MKEYVNYRISNGNSRGKWNYMRIVAQMIKLLLNTISNYKVNVKTNISNVEFHLKSYVMYRICTEFS